MTTFVASLFNLAGPDLIVMLLILLVMGIPIVGIVILVRYLTRKSQTPRAGPLGIIPVEERLQKLEELKAKGMLTQAEL